jgi:hypothetical protein
MWIKSKIGKIAEGLKILKAKAGPQRRHTHYPVGSWRSHGLEFTPAIRRLSETGSEIHQSAGDQLARRSQVQ